MPEKLEQLFFQTIENFKDLLNDGQKSIFLRIVLRYFYDLSYPVFRISISSLEDPQLIIGTKSQLNLANNLIQV